MKLYKTLLSTMFMLLLLSPPGFSQNKLTVPLSQPDSPGNLEINMMQATLKITGYDGKDVVINYDGDVDEGRKQNQNPNREGLRRLTNNVAGFEVHENRNTVVISGNHSIPRELEMNIQVPRNFSVKISLIHGEDLVIENINGELEVSHVNGDILLKNIGGSAVVNTVNGDITATFQRVSDDKPMAFSNVNGDIDVTLPANARLSPKIRAEFGDIFTDFDINMSPSQSPNITKSDSKSGRSGSFRVEVNTWVQGNINGGGPEYLFKTFRGDVIIRKQ